MGLGLSTGGTGGSRTPYISYDARAGRMFRVDRAQGSDGTWSSNKVDITNDCVFIADMQNIKVGWVSFTDQGPSKQLVTIGQPIPSRPEGKKSDGKPLFQQGFEVNVVLSKSAGGGPARELCSSAGCVIEAIDALHDAFLANPDSKQGKLPVVKMTTAVPVKAGQSTNYKPVFEIIGWKDRPSELADLPVTASPPTAAAAPPATGSTVVGAPQATPAPAPAMAAVDDFG